MTIAVLRSGSEKIAPRKTAENTVKHHDGSVGSVTSDHGSKPPQWRWKFDARNNITHCGFSACIGQPLFDRRTSTDGICLSKVFYKHLGRFKVSENVSSNPVISSTIFVRLILSNMVHINKSPDKLYVHAKRYINIEKYGLINYWTKDIDPIYR